MGLFAFLPARGNGQRKRCHLHVDHVSRSFILPYLKEIREMSHNIFVNHKQTLKLSGDSCTSRGGEASVKNTLPSVWWWESYASVI